MSRYQFDDVSEPETWTDRSTKITQFIVRAFGFLLMVVGLWIGLKAINEAWGLYKEPHRIERFATAIEKGSNLDKTLSTVHAEQSNEQTNVDRTLGFRLSYFVAWVLAILLLMLVGRLAIAAIKTGGELALYDMQIKKFAKLLAQQSGKNL